MGKLNSRIRKEARRLLKRRNKFCRIRNEGFMREMGSLNASLADDGTYFATVSKFGADANRVNEDYCGVRHIDADNIIYGLSDGAGGYGVFAAQWSKALIDNLPSNAISNAGELDAYIDGLEKEFRAEYEAKARERNPFVYNKFLSEGSCATLVGVWRHKLKYNYLLYGDSTFMIYNKRSMSLKLVGGNIKELKDFLGNPPLISLNDRVDAGRLYLGGGHFESGDIMLLMSDSLSQYVMINGMISSKSDALRNEGIIDVLNSGSKLSNVLKNNIERDMPLNSIIKELVDRAKDARRFESYISGLYKAGLLLNDDYTILIKEI